MINSSNKLTIYFFITIVSLLTGFIIYLLFRENTYISRFIENFVDLSAVRKWCKPLESDFLKYYFPDYLWSLSLTSALHMIYNHKKLESWICSLSTLILGCVYELLQYLDLISGTGDFVDVLLYLLGGFTINVIAMKRRKEK